MDLRSNALFRGIPPDLLEKLDLTLETADYAPGEIIIEEGSEGTCCFLIESGRVRISKDAGNGGHETLGFKGPGDFFGELSLYYSAARSARAAAITPTRTRKLGREDFDRLRESFPLELTTAIAGAAVQHLGHVHENLLQHLTDSDRFRTIGIGLGSLAHMVRGPLATIQMAADCLADLARADGPDREQIPMFIDIIQRTARDALATADDLLAEIRGERSSTAMESVPISELVDEVLGQIGGLLLGGRAELTSRVAYTGRVVCHRGDLASAIANLLRNAVEALPSEGGTVRLEIEQQGDDVVVAVSDDGIGIPEDIQGMIFERRFTRGKAQGTGLGLDQVRRSVERHGGRIELNSEVGQGTTFRVRIPVRSGHSPVDTVR